MFLNKPRLEEPLLGALFTQSGRQQKLANSIRSVRLFVLCLFAEAIYPDFRDMSLRRNQRVVRRVLEDKAVPLLRLPDAAVSILNSYQLDPLGELIALTQVQ